NTPPWDPSDTFQMYDKKGNLLPPDQKDIYIGARNCKVGCKDNTAYTGYTTARDAGTKLTLRAGTGDNINPSFYYSWKMPDDVGGDFYRENIAHCNQSRMVYDPAHPTIMIQEPGAKAGPTLQGIQDLIDQDPGARWEPAPGC